MVIRSGTISVAGVNLLQSNAFGLFFSLKQSSLLKIPSFFWSCSRLYLIKAMQMPSRKAGIFCNRVLVYIQLLVEQQKAKMTFPNSIAAHFSNYLELLLRALSSFSPKNRFANWFVQSWCRFGGTACFIRKNQ